MAFRTEQFLVPFIFKISCLFTLVMVHFQLFVYILKNVFSAFCLHCGILVSFLFTLWHHCQLFVYIMQSLSAVCLHFKILFSAFCLHYGILVSCLFILWNPYQLFVYIMGPMSAVCLQWYLNCRCS